MTCREKADYLYFKIKDHNDELYGTVRIENLQYFRLEITYIGDPLVMKRSKLYLLYKGNNVLFTGDEVVHSNFTSLELQFGYFYKT
jgi:hypothetical protein